MILNGKALEDFEKWYFENHCSSNIKFEDLLPHHVYDVFGWLYKQSLTIQNAFVIEFFDEQEYKIEADVYNLWNYCFVKCYWDRGFKEYKQSVVQAIKKANEIYNAKTS